MNSAQAQQKSMPKPKAMKATSNTGSAQKQGKELQKKPSMKAKAEDVKKKPASSKDQYKAGAFNEARLKFVQKQLVAWWCGFLCNAFALYVSLHVHLHGGN